MENVEIRRQQKRSAARTFRLRHPEKIQENYRKRIRTPEKRRADLLRWSYNITVEEWDTLFESQGSCCAICKTTNPKGRNGWHTDHCHQTNRVRGILCNNCNIGLGNFRDNPASLKEALNYLQRKLI